MPIKEGSLLVIDGCTVTVSYVGETVIQVLHSDGTRQTINKKKVI
jgi:hypothetical protein